MSHFSVLVISDSPDSVEDLLAPYVESPEEDDINFTKFGLAFKKLGGLLGNTGEPLSDSNAPLRSLLFRDEEDSSFKEWSEGSIEYLEFPSGHRILPWNYGKLEGVQENYFQRSGEPKYTVEPIKVLKWFDNQKDAAKSILARQQEPDNVFLFEIKTDGSNFCIEKRVKPIEDLKKVKIRKNEVYPTFEDYMSDWCGYAMRDPDTNSYGNWYNPHAKWDWYEVGGRWKDSLRCKEGTSEEDYVCQSDSSGEKSLLCDSAKVEVLDLEAMLQANRKSKGELWDKAESKYKESASRYGLHNLSYRDATLWLKYQRDYFHSLFKESVESDFNNFIRVNFPYRCEAYFKYDRACGDSEFMYGIEPGDSRESFVDKAVAISSFAVLKDGKWYERGGMGWWGIVRDEKDKEVWKDEFRRLLSDLDGDDWITLVDCHI